MCASSRLTRIWFGFSIIQLWRLFQTLSILILILDLIRTKGGPSLIKKRFRISTPDPSNGRSVIPSPLSMSMRHSKYFPLCTYRVKDSLIYAFSSAGLGNCGAKEGDTHPQTPDWNGNVEATNGRNIYSIS